MKCGLHLRQLISRYFAFFLAPLGSLCRFLAHTGALGRDQDGGILGSFAHFLFLFVWTEQYRIQTLWSSRPLDNGEPGLQKSFFSALRASVWLRGSAPPPPGPSAGSATAEFKLRSKNTWSKTEANTHPPSLRSRSYGDKLSQERASLSQPS